MPLSTGSSAQGSVTPRWVGERPKRERIDTHVADSLHCTAESNTTL